MSNMRCPAYSVTKCTWTTQTWWLTCKRIQRSLPGTLDRLLPVATTLDASTPGVVLGRVVESQIEEEYAARECKGREIKGERKGD